MLFRISISHAFINVMGKIIMLTNADFVSDHFQQIKKPFITNQELFKLSIYRFKPVC